MALFLKPVVSSMISSIGFDANSKRLCLQFPNGKCYEYSGVDSETFLRVVTAESTGKAFNEHIKNGGFKFKKIELADV